jgi:DNA-binding beta-propeller fold protein YncE
MNETPALEIVSFRAVPSSAPPGGVVELSWHTRLAESCTLEPGNIAVPIVGQHVIQVKETVTYTLVALGASSQASASVAITVSDRERQPPHSGIEAAPEETVFDYAVSPGTVYVTRDPSNPSVAKLDIGVSNNTGGDAVCDSISFAVRIGAAGSDLTQDAAISTSVSQPDKWSIAPIIGAPGQFRAAPVSPNTGLKARESISFRLDDIDVNREPGSTRLRVVELVDKPLEYSKTINKIRADLDIKYFQPNPLSIEPGRSSTLSWKTEAAAGCTLSWGPAGCKGVPVTGETDVHPQETTIYTLTARGGLGPPISKQTAVVVGKVDVSLTAKPLTVDPGGSSELIWKVRYSNPGTCRLDPGDIEIEPEGQDLVTLQESTTYSVSARGGTSFDRKQVTISVVPPKPKILKFHGSVAVKGSQLRLTLAWIADGADEVTITHHPSPLKPIGELVISPSKGDTLHGAYTLKARTGQDAVTSTVSIMWAAAKSTAVGKVLFEFVRQGCAILPDGSRLFCVNIDHPYNVSVLDPETLAHVPDPPFKVDSAPIMIAASPDSKCVYVSQLIWGFAFISKLSAYDSRDFRPVPGSAESKTHEMKGFAVTPDGEQVWVSSIGKFPPGDDKTVRVYDTSDMRLVRSVTVGGREPMGIAFTPRGTTPARAFVAIFRDSALAVIDTETFEQETIPLLGGRPASVAVTPDGKQLYVGSLTQIWVFDVETLEQLGSITAGGGSGLAPSPDGRLIFATQGSSLHVIDTATRTLVGTCDIGKDSSLGLAVSPDGFRVFVLCTTPYPEQAGTLWMFLPDATGGTG